LADGHWPTRPAFPGEDHTVRMLEIVTGIEGVDANVPNSSGDTPLIALARRAIMTKGSPTSSMTSALSILLFRGADTDATNLRKESALHILAENGFQPGLVEVLRHKPKVDVSDDLGWTPLHRAIRGGYVDDVHLLLEHEKNVQEKDESGSDTGSEHWTDAGHLPLHVAAMYGRDAIVSLLWEIREISDINLRTRQPVADTALHIAARNGDLSVVEILINLGTEIYCLNNSKNTTLHLAASRGFKLVARFLIKKGARASLENISGLTPWMEAALYGYKELKDFLVKCANGDQLTEAERKESTTRTNEGRFSGFGPGNHSSRPPPPPNPKAKGEESIESETESQQFSRLMKQAVKTTNAKICKVLVESRGDSNVPINEKAATALHIACASTSLDVVNLLLELGVQVNIEDIFGNFPVHLAALGNSTETIKRACECRSKYICSA
jgi:ankyrin repeat protein